nr:translation initiation factor IF-2-like [Macaca fascicularis]
MWGGFPHLWLCTACARVCPGVPSLRGRGRGPCASPADPGSAGVRPPAAGAQGQQPPNPRGRGVKETILSALAGATPARGKAPKEKPGQGHWGREKRPPAGTSGGARGVGIRDLRPARPTTPARRPTPCNPHLVPGPRPTPRGPRPQSRTPRHPAWAAGRSSGRGAARSAPPHPLPAPAEAPRLRAPPGGGGGGRRREEELRREGERGSRPGREAGAGLRRPPSARSRCGAPAAELVFASGRRGRIWRGPGRGGRQARGCSGGSGAARGPAPSRRVRGRGPGPGNRERGPGPGPGAGTREPGSRGLRGRGRLFPTPRPLRPRRAGPGRCLCCPQLAGERPGLREAWAAARGFRGSAPRPGPFSDLRGLGLGVGARRGRRREGGPGARRWDSGTPPPHREVAPALVEVQAGAALPLKVPPAGSALTRV